MRRELFQFIVGVVCCVCLVRFALNGCKVLPSPRLPKRYLQPYTNHPRHDGSIFVSVASYRDRKCADTVKDAFDMANDPKLLYIGIVQQNKQEDVDCLCTHMANVRTLKLDYSEARGPCYARYLCSCLYQGETYFLQIDSHTKFLKGWDDELRRMLAANAPNGVLSHYPQPWDMTTNATGHGREGTIPRNCGIKVDRKGMIQYIAREKPKPKLNTFHKSHGIAGGFMAMPGEILIDVPFDPDLDDLFQGEEILYAARLYTHGYDFYVPDKNILYHWYGRKNEPRYWSDLLGFEKPAINPMSHVFRKLGLHGHSKDFGIYGLGRIRPLSGYWEMLSFDPVNKKVTRNTCED